MSVLIKGIEMPESCFNCKFPRACQAINRRIDEKVMAGLFPKDHRHSDCPLIEVPEQHGDLVDRKAVLDTFRDHMSVTRHFVMLRDEIPTVIPSSEE